MGCFAQTTNTNIYEALNKQGIYPPEQVEEVFNLLWGDRDENAIVNRHDAKDLLRDCVQTLAALGDERKFNAELFDKLSAKYTSFKTFQFAAKRQNLLDILNILMAPPSGYAAPAPIPAPKEEKQASNEAAAAAVQPAPVAPQQAVAAQ